MPPHDEVPLDLDLLGKVGTFLLFTAGLSAVFAGGQVWWVVTFRDPWQAAIPVMHAATGAAAIYVSTQLAYPRRWALFGALVLLLGLAFVAGIWGGWLMWNGMFSALAVFAPSWAVVALPIVGVSAPGVLRVARAREAADRETSRLTTEALAPSGYGFFREPRAQSRWMLPLLYAVAALPIGGLVLAMAYPEAFERAQVRCGGLLAGRSPFGSGFVETPTAFPYAGSPLEWYLEYEATWTPLDRQLVLRMADGVADDVAWALASYTGEADPVVAEMALWTQGDAKQLPTWIASSLRRHGVIAYPESLFSRSFDPEMHALPETVHLDCDQLSYVFLHIARRLDLDMKVLPAVQHTYIRYDGPAGEPSLYIETTSIAAPRQRDRHGEAVPATLGEGFFIEEDHYPSGRGGSWATEEVVAAAGLYQPWTERDIRDNIVANVVVGMASLGRDLYPAEPDAHVVGTRSIVLVSNLYRWNTDQAEAALDGGQRADAETYALRARQLRADHPGLVIYGRTPEEDVLTTIAATGADAMEAVE
ncbi:MAG: hypothetical protein EXR71_02505 [Myxococcales bacterium]|nr:hypothetical protein [Myxococcales bacterium]